MTSNRALQTSVNKIALLLYPLFLSSCHDFSAIEPVEKIPLSRAHSSFFGSCYPSEGGGRVIWLKEKTPLAEARLDWLASPRKSWQTQLSDPFGMILLDLEWRKSPLRYHQQGKLLSKVPELKVNQEGFWEANGIMVGLKAEEIPCILGGKFPVYWRDMIYKKLDKSEQSTLYIAENSRKIEITFHKPGGKIREACALFKWNQFLGIKTGEINWCIARSHKKSRLDLPDEQTLRWEQSDA
ncbi:MAG: hypothetical protein HRU09_01740 [Oligoflexales bacterium]|nr:hypothetical protein [Oligoflexales bacterium]